MSLNKQQFKFEQMCNLLEAYILFRGYQYTTADALRDARAHGKYGERGCAPYGSPRSYHKKGLARDYNLFLNGKYLTKTSDHAQFGAFWKLLGGTWGGDFRKKDGNHYSLGEGKR